MGPNVGFQIMDFHFRISAFIFRTPNSEFQILDPGLERLESKFRFSDSGFLNPNFEY